MPPLHTGWGQAPRPRLGDSLAQQGFGERGLGMAQPLSKLATTHQKISPV